MGRHNFKGAANGVLHVLQRMSRDFRFNVYIASEISLDIQCNIYISPVVHDGMNIVPRTLLVIKELGKQLATTALFEQLATTALNEAKTAFSTWLATLDTQLVRTALDQWLLKKKHSTTGIGNMHVKNSSRLYARKHRHTRDRQQLNYSNTCAKNKFLDTVFRCFCSFLATQSENTLYAHVVFFLVFVGTQPFDSANSSSMISFIYVAFKNNSVQP